MKTSEEVEIYNAINKVTAESFLEASTKLIARLQALFALSGNAGEQPKGDLKLLLDGSQANAQVGSIFTKYSGDEIKAVWRKYAEAVDIEMAFRPRLPLPPQTLSSLTVAGDKVSIAPDSPSEFINAMANWEVEINLGIIRGKVSW